MDCGVAAAPLMAPSTCDGLFLEARSVGCLKEPLSEKGASKPNTCLGADLAQIECSLGERISFLEEEHKSSQQFCQLALGNSALPTDTEQSLQSLHSTQSYCGGV